MTGCQIIEINALYANGKPISGLTETPLQLVQGAIMKQAREAGKSAKQAYELANKARLYPIDFRNVEIMQEEDLANIKRNEQS